MNCQDAKSLIMEYLDGELAPPERTRLEQHLAGCEACRQERDAQRQVINCVQALPRAKAPADLALRVNEAAVAEARRQTSSRARAGRRLALAASVAIAAGVLTILATTNNNQPGESTKATEMAAADRPPQAERLKPPAPAEKPSEALLEKEAGKDLEAAPGGRAADKPAAAPAAAAAPAEQPALRVDLVVEADDTERCMDDLAKFLEARRMRIVGRITAEHSVLIAAPAAGPEQGSAKGAAPGGIVREIASAGRFSVKGLADAEASAADKMKAEDVAAGAPAAEPAEVSRPGWLAILVVKSDANAPKAAVDGATSEPAAGRE